MNKKLYARLSRFVVNVMPCIRGGGGKVMHISEDFMHLRVKLALTWRTRNIMGTIYGGSMYASTDPFYMLMLMRILGKDYVVWDKGCSFRFKRPAKETIYADFVITPQMLNDLRTQVESQGETTVTWPLQYKSKDGTVYVEFEKMLYVAKKSVYDEKQRRRAAKVST
jgi:hypothetical protein